MEGNSRKPCNNRKAFKEKSPCINTDLDADTAGIWDLQMISTALNNISDEVLRLMVHMAAAHTCRNGELCGLTWSSLHLEKGAMKIDKTLKRISKKSFDELPSEDIFEVFPNSKADSKSVMVLKKPKSNGSDAKTVQSITGHATAEFVFDVYNHSIMDKQRFLVKKLEQIMYGGEYMQENNTQNISADDVLAILKTNPGIAESVYYALHEQVAADAKFPV
jgi:hypothetical protein